ncbi:PREDICTED: uncharacterized protein LOC106815062 [Priapulus caudatus]|uniref:Uncharacterized protein LOC106815062 n=1 Tax=Priapulus caudatus TaxID=37621 RepID=A0ABM1ES04_PRICU|nr:PREDICTED: uncharacterized protein LOC106815062 [Priapulus caudatus]
MAESRRNSSKQKKTQRKKERKSLPITPLAKPLEEDPLPSTSKSKFYRIRQNVMDKMPTTPRSYAKLVRTLSKKMPGEKKAKISLSYEGIKEKVKEIRKKPTNKNRTFVYQLGSCVGWKFGRKYLGLSWKTCIASKKGKLVKKKYMKGKVLSVANQDLVQEFWWSSEVSRQMPLKKKVKKNQAAFLLELNYTQAYRKFKAAHPSVKIGYVKFTQLKPSNVRRMNALERVVCCCQRCENVKLKVKAMNSSVSSNGCRDLRIEAEDLSAISDITLCHDDNRTLPKANCLDRQCTSCSEKNMTTHYAAFLKNNRELKLNFGAV